MRLGLRRGIVGAIATTTGVWLLGVVLIGGQAAPAQTPPMSDAVFKNVQVLKGIPVNEFMGTMGVFSASLGMSCEDCHAAGDANWAVYATDSPRKQMARVMVLMMANINRTNFGGRQVVTCYTCHRGSARPRAIADLADLYGVPTPDPNAVFEQARLAPSADEVLDKYIQAVGGAQRLAALTSVVAKGISVGYGPEAEKRPVDIYARAQGQRTTIIHTSAGDSTTTYDGNSGWIAAPFRPVAGTGSERARSRWPQARHRSGLSGSNQAGPDQVARRAAGCDQRPRHASCPGNQRPRGCRDAVLRRRVRPAGAAGAVRRFPGRSHFYSGRVFRLPRRRRRQDAPPFYDDLVGRTGRVRAE